MREKTLILLVTDGGATLWGSGAPQAFTTDAASLATFSACVAGATVLLVADALDETFSVESVPRLGRKDADALLRRRMHRLRDDEARGCLVTLRGRQAQIALLPESRFLEAWLSALQSAGAILTGITSVPLLLADWLRARHAMRGWVLGVFRLAAGELRCVVLENGAIRCSRRLAMTPAGSPDDDIARGVAVACEWYPGLSEKIHVQTLLPDAMPALVSFAKKRKLAANYARPAELERFRRRQRRRRWWWTSALSSLMFTTLVVAALMDAAQASSRAIVFRHEAARLSRSVPGDAQDRAPLAVITDLLTDISQRVAAPPDLENMLSAAGTVLLAQPQVVLEELEWSSARGLRLVAHFEPAPTRHGELADALARLQAAFGATPAQVRVQAAAATNESRKEQALEDLQVGSRDASRFFIALEYWRRPDAL